MTDSSVRFQLAEDHYVVLQRGDVRAVVVDNAELDLQDLPGHWAGYNGMASLTHRHRDANLFVPAVAGLNFEHIHDGRAAGLKEKFEPRKSPMQLRVVDRHTVEVHQAATANWKLESCGRYQLLEDGTIEYTFECIPRTGGYSGMPRCFSIAAPPGLWGVRWAALASPPCRQLPLGGWAVPRPWPVA